MIQKGQKMPRATRALIRPCTLQLQSGSEPCKNRLHSLTNVVDKTWIDLSLESKKLECKKRVIQSSLISL